MAHLHEQELYCKVCKIKKDLPVCCGNEMEYDNVVFFCNVCRREAPHYYCCGEEMEICTKVKNIKKDIFGAI